MSLNSFRELLIKRAEGGDLQGLIKFIKDDVLADVVFESLEKMARGGNKGDTANFATRNFASDMDHEHEPSMIHDALSHHVSHYKAALNSGNNKVAGQHANQIYRIMDMADQAQTHSGGKLKVDAVSPHAWERNKFSDTFGERASRLSALKDSGQTLTPKDEKWLQNNPVTRGSKKDNLFVTNTKGWRYRGSDFDFLQQSPHHSKVSEIRTHGHNGAYPLEHIKINGKHIDVEDVAPEEATKYTAHPFDNHPVMEHFEEASANRGLDRDMQYTHDADAFQDSPHMDKYFTSMEGRQINNPNKFASRGETMSSPVHQQVAVPLSLDREDAPKSAAQKPQAQQAQSSEPASEKAPTTFDDDFNEYKEKFPKFSDKMINDLIRIKRNAKK